MSSATQILFNSPALHSLKRDQLVKLCKTHSLKANGKNVELIERLKEHARGLPKDSPLSIAARSEEERSSTPENDTEMDVDSDVASQEGQSSSYQSSRARPSEQWEMVMDSIQEEDEHPSSSSSSQNTLTSQRTVGNGHSSTGEFGTGGSKTSTVSSSIRALATSLGLKRSTSSKSSSTMPALPPPSSSSSLSSSKQQHPPSSFPALTKINDELAQTSTPYASLPQNDPPPQTDHFVLNPLTPRVSLDGTSEPLPGHALRPGVPAPQNARLSMGYGLGGNPGSVPATPSRHDNQPTTTIRLISNPLTSSNNNSTPPPPGAFDFFGIGSNAYAPGVNGTPQLKPFHTTFDLVLGSPEPATAGRGSNIYGGGFYQSFGTATKSSTSLWPPTTTTDTPTKTPGSIYPRLTRDLIPTMPSPSPLRATASTTTTGVTQLQPPSPTPHSKTLARDAAEDASEDSNDGLSAPAPIPFIFGSPNPRHSISNAQFRSAASSVLEEMNKRLRAEGVDEMTTGIIDKLHPGASVQPAVDDRPVKPLPGSAKKQPQEQKDKFDQIHAEQETKRMEGIDSYVKRRAEAVGSSVVVGKKRKSSVLGDARRPGGGGKGPTNTSVISASRRAKALPGAFGMDDDDSDDNNNDNDDNNDCDNNTNNNDDDDDEGRRPEKRVRVNAEGQSRASDANALKAKREELEKEALRRKLEANRAARRRSSAVGGVSGGAGGRKSVGRGRVSAAAKQKPKPSRFGFFSTAKSIVQSVWNRGKQPASASTNATTTTTAAAPSFSKPTSTSMAKTNSNNNSTANTAKSTMPPPSNTAKKPSSAPARPTSAASNAPVATGSRVSSLRSLAPKPASATATDDASTSSRRSRSPLPSFDTPTTATRSSIATKSSRPSSSLATKVSTTRSGGVSSIGTRMSSRSSSSNAAAASGVAGNSLGVRKVSGAGVGSGGSTTGRSRTSAVSRLLAPTASSLAKSARRPSSTPVVRGSTPQPAQGALGPITNVLSPTDTMSPPPTNATGGRERGKIFSKPLHQSSGIPIPSPVKRAPSSATTTSTAEMGVKSPSSGSSPSSKSNGTLNTLASSGSGGSGGSIRSLSGRKPRISRSKVIARLASQRQAGGSGRAAAATTAGGASAVAGSSGRPSTGSALKPVTGRKSSGSGLLVPRQGKTRSSLGARGGMAIRASYGGGGGGRASSGGGKEGNVLMSAKKRARLSEAAKRRRSRAAVEAAGAGMDVCEI